MEVFKNITIICGSVTGFAAVCAIIWKVVKWFLALQDQIKEIARHERENYIATLRMTIMSPFMPMSERLNAGKRYVEDYNENGAVKAKYNALIKQNESNCYDE